MNLVVYLDLAGLRVDMQVEGEERQRDKDGIGR